MITLKDALHYYVKYLQERMQKCDEVSGKMPGFIAQIERLVEQELLLIQELGNLEKELTELNEQQEALQVDLQTVNELERLEATIREREQSREDLLGRLNIGDAKEEGVKLLNLDIDAMVVLRERNLKLLKERGIDRIRLRDTAPSLEARVTSLSDVRVQKEAELRELGVQRQRLTLEFDEFKLLEKERLTHEFSSKNLKQLIELVEGIPLGADTISVEQGVQVEEGAEAC